MYQVWYEKKEFLPRRWNGLRGGQTVTAVSCQHKYPSQCCVYMKEVLSQQLHGSDSSFEKRRVFNIVSVSSVSATICVIQDLRPAWKNSTVTWGSFCWGSNMSNRLLKSSLQTAQKIINYILNKSIIGNHNLLSSLSPAQDLRRKSISTETLTNPVCSKSQEAKIHPATASSANCFPNWSWVRAETVPN